ncbi:hypothetical protein [Pantoea sp. AMG 501]|uniref:hypothetical protein n=1 Tax=Pantoea sp. AMG 501 TaxID=2008894 RepID=UPI002016169D|nr:hypothetical protein [Pantoea sp. AMG 501]
MAGTIIVAVGGNQHQRAEHSQRIASREELLKELALDKQEAMLKCCGSGKKYVESHSAAFTGFADTLAVSRA